MALPNIRLDNLNNIVYYSKVDELQISKSRHVKSLSIQPIFYEN